MNKELVIEPKKPYLFEDEEYKTIDLSGLEELTMQDAIEAQKNVVGSGEDTVVIYAPEASQAFIDEIAALAAKQPVEFFNGMSIGLSGKVLRLSGSVRCPRGLAVLLLARRRHCVFGCGELGLLGRCRDLGRRGRCA